MALAPEIESILAQLEEALVRWHREKKLGEIAVVIGEHGYQVEERPIHKHDRVPRTQRGSSMVERVQQT